MKNCAKLYGGGALIALLAGLPAIAQAAPAGPEEPLIAEIVVTAQKREQSLNDVGQAITAASGETLTRRGVSSLADLTKITPGFTYVDSLYSTPVYTLRGVGLYDNSFGGAPAVAVYTDQAPRNVSVMSTGLDLDVERVEVLKGPQGTLFGQSATGGAINIITAKPTKSFTAGFDASYERFDKVTTSAFLSGPITETLLARAAFKGVSGGAWQYNSANPSQKNGDTRQLTGRLTLDWKPVDGVKLVFSATGGRDTSDAVAPQFEGTRFNIYSNSAALAASGNPYGHVDAARYADYTTTTSAGYDSGFLSRQSTLVSRMNGGSAGAKALLGTAIPTDARAASWSTDFLRKNNNSYYQFALRADIRLSDTLTLTSMTALARQKLDFTTDLDATAAEADNVYNTGTVNTFNQELRIAGDSAKLHWIVGASFDQIKANQNLDYRISDWSANVVFPGVPIVENYIALNTLQKSYSGFGNVEYKVTPKFSLQGGLRFSRNEISANECNSDLSSGHGTDITLGLLSDLVRGLSFGTTGVTPGQCHSLDNVHSGAGFFAPTVKPYEMQLNQQNLSFRAGATYKMDSGELLYANISQGYKAGLFSPIGGTFTSQFAPAGQERVMAYEAGFKAPLFDRRVHLNGSVFYYDYANKQLRARVLDSSFGLLEKLVNVPKSRIWGLEFDARADVAKGLTLSAAVTYMQSKVTGDFSATSDGQAIYNIQGYTGNFRGSKLPFTPQWSGNADVSYEWAVGNVKPFAGASVQFQSASNATFVNSVLKASEDEIPGYATVDLRAGVGAEDGAWKLWAFGRNVFNKYYRVSVSENLDNGFQVAGKPITYGLTLQMRVR